MKGSTCQLDTEHCYHCIKRVALLLLYQMGVNWMMPIQQSAEVGRMMDDKDSTICQEGKGNEGLNVST
eukprot:8152735-Ditylum_brightwellii.AAC.1